MSKLQTAVVEVWEGQVIATRARIRGVDGVALSQATVTGVELRVYDLSSTSPHTAIYSESLADTACFPSATEQLYVDASWDIDSTGYNFAHSLAGDDSLFVAQGGHTYRIEYEVATTDATYGKAIVITIARVRSRHKV